MPANISFFAITRCLIYFFEIYTQKFHYTHLTNGYNMSIMGIIRTEVVRMDRQEVRYRIEEIEKQIEGLPKGSIGTKSGANGRTYYYHRYMENGKRVEKYVAFEDVAVMQEQIARRKALEMELKALKKEIGDPQKVKVKKLNNNIEFRTFIRIGEELKKFAGPVKKYKKRECFSKLYDYVYGDIQDRVFILYGLRRTGKTTLIRQLLAGMRPSELEKAAFIQVSAKDTLADINKDMRILEKNGYRYIFLDEVTLMEDFIEGAALFSDVFASCGMKIVLSGTDSLGFRLSESEQLYDRCILLHTTFIPYREFEQVLGIKGIDEYIRYGGTMSLGGVNYNKDFVFDNNNKVNEYVDSAIAHNIQHSLKCYQDGGHFRHLAELYEKNELTNAINRVVEDINRKFTKEVITRKYKSNDLKRSARNLRRDRVAPTSILDDIDEEAFTTRLKELLEILDKEEQTVAVSDTHAVEIKEYLVMLDLLYEIDLRAFPNINNVLTTTVISQPGMRFAQANALVESLLCDEKFNEMQLSERNRVIARILSEIQGRMMEDIVLLETKLASPKKQVFRLQFADGEFDMVVFEPQTESCTIFEVKHSKEVMEEQYRHLINKEKCTLTEQRFGTITGKYVVYRGETQDVESIHYVNVEEYLRSL